MRPHYVCGVSPPYILTRLAGQTFDDASGTNPKHDSEAAIAKSRKVVDRSLRALMQEMEHENTLMQDTPSSRLQKVLKLFRGTRPLFAVISSLPLIPSPWRASIVMLTQALDALAVVAPDVSVAFKAGKDL